MNGNEVWFNPAEGNEFLEKNEQGKKVENKKYWEVADRTMDKRIKALNTLATDISAADFCKNNI